MVADMLAHAEQHFWTDTAELYLDRMNIQRPREDATAQHLRLQELNNARGQRVVMLLVSLRYDELPRQQKLSDLAERYLR
jgi:hypothetical protein